MRILDRYLLKNLALGTAFVTLTLAVIVFLTQSLRFLELVINSGASSSTFWILTLLALPRFFEVIVPLALMAAILFVYNRMTMDSELVAARAAGLSPLNLARPALQLAAVLMLGLWLMTLWIAPLSLSGMQQLKQAVKAQVSSLLFREGVFNSVKSGLTVYVREHQQGELRGIMIHDGRDNQKNPSVILAKRGQVSVDEKGYRITVFDGSRQEFDPERKILHSLNFERYRIDLPDSDPVGVRWQEPDERTIGQLLNPDPSSAKDAESLRDFLVEIHRRIITPLLAPLFALVSLACLLTGPLDRRGLSKRIAAAILFAVVVQSLYLASLSLAKHSNLGLVLLYGIVLLPIAFFLKILAGPRSQTIEFDYDDLDDDHHDSLNGGNSDGDNENTAGASHA